MNDHLIRLICETGQPDIVLKHHHLNYREREKRKKEIRDFISRSFNWHGNPMPTGDQVRERISELPDYQIPLTTTATPNLRATHYTERVQSFFPICKYFESNADDESPV